MKDPLEMQGIVRKEILSNKSHICGLYHAPKLMKLCTRLKRGGNLYVVKVWPKWFVPGLSCRQHKFHLD